jgi:hypothetical protein
MDKSLWDEFSNMSFQIRRKGYSGLRIKNPASSDAGFLKVRKWRF